MHFLIMQNAGYKRFGFLLTIFLAPYYIASRAFAIIKNIQTFICVRETIKLSIKDDFAISSQYHAISPFRSVVS